MDVFSMPLIKINPAPRCVNIITGSRSGRLKEWNAVVIHVLFSNNYYPMFNVRMVNNGARLNRGKKIIDSSGISGLHSVKNLRCNIQMINLLISVCQNEFFHYSFMPRLMLHFHITRYISDISLFGISL